MMKGLEALERKFVPQDFFTAASFDRSRRLVFTNGCFDVLHLGHVSYLAKARALGDLLVVGLNSDASVRRLKGPSRPVNDQQARAYLLAALEMVDFVVLFEEDTPYQLIQKVLPDVLVKGGDYDVDQIVGADVVRQHGGRVLTIPLVEGYASTTIINRLK